MRPGWFSRDATPAALEDIRQRVLELARLIDAPLDALPTYGVSRDMAYPHIEVHGPWMHYVVQERGVVWRREKTRDLDELLAFVFHDVTFYMASQFELAHRRPDEDSRRQLFAKELEYLGMLNPHWAEQQRARLNEILSRHPFTDGRQPTDKI